MVGEVAGETIGKVLELGLEYNPLPPFKTGHPSIADENTLTIAKQTFAQTLSVDRIRDIAATRHSRQRKYG
jgi:cyclohexyl-isocyanide hydratase